MSEMTGAKHFDQADYYQRHLFLSVLCHAISSKKASPLDPKYFQDELGVLESEDDTEDDSDSEDGNQTDALPEEDNKKTLLRRVTRRGRRRKSKSMDTEAAKTSRHPSLGWTDTMTFLNPVGYIYMELDSADANGSIRRHAGDRRNWPNSTL
jgi:hypothetical protein